MAAKTDRGSLIRAHRYQVWLNALRSGEALCAIIAAHYLFSGDLEQLFSGLDSRSGLLFGRRGRIR